MDQCFASDTGMIGAFSWRLMSLLCKDNRAPLSPTAILVVETIGMERVNVPPTVTADWLLRFSCKMAVSLTTSSQLARLGGRRWPVTKVTWRHDWTGDYQIAVVVVIAMLTEPHYLSPSFTDVPIEASLIGEQGRRLACVK
jgi:hypothetical protein